MIYGLFLPHKLQHELFNTKNNWTFGSGWRPINICQVIEERNVLNSVIYIYIYLHPLTSLVMFTKPVHLIISSFVMCSSQCFLTIFYLKISRCKSNLLHKEGIKQKNSRSKKGKSWVKWSEYIVQWAWCLYNIEPDKEESHEVVTPYMLHWYSYTWQDCTLWKHVWLEVMISENSRNEEELICTNGSVTYQRQSAWMLMAQSHDKVLMEGDIAHAIAENCL